KKPTLIGWVSKRKRRLLNRHRDRNGCDSIGHNLQIAGAGLRTCGHIELRGNNALSRRHSHRAVIVSPGVEDVTRALVGDANDWIVSRCGGVIPVTFRLRQSVELRALDWVRHATGHRTRRTRDGRSPGWIGCADWSVNLHIL